MKKKRRKVFVFGSNQQGRHGAGAALEAYINWEAVSGQARGLQGNSYGIVTKELRKNKPKVTLFDIAIEVEAFLEFAKEHPEMDFLLTPIGCGLAGFKAEDIAPMFAEASKNVIVPTAFLEIIYGDCPD